MEGSYTEKILRIPDRNRAAALLAFGAHLQSHLPLEWVEEFESKAAYLAWRKDRTNPKLQPQVVVTLNFVPDEINAKEITEAYEAEGAEDRFLAQVKGLGLEDAVLQEVLALHSRALVSVVREALDSREWLIERMAQCPENAKWIRVKSTGPLCGLFGKLASAEKIADVLDSIN
jgi:hypothetical protein